MAKESLQEVFHTNQELRKLLDLAFGKQVGCAVGLSLDKKEAVLVLDRRAKGRKLAKKLKGDMAGKVNPASVRFGYVSIEDGDQNTVRLFTNKSLVGGTVPAVLKIVRKAGFTGVDAGVDDKVENEPEEADGEDDAAEAAPTPGPAAPAAAPAQSNRPAEAAPAATQAPASAAAPSPAPSAPAPSAPSPAAQDAAPPPAADGMARLEKLIKLVGPAVMAYPSRKARLVELANDAKKSVLAGEDADAKLRALETELREIAKARSEGRQPQGDSAAQQGAAPSEEAAKASLARADQLWRGASGQMRKDLNLLKTAILDAYADNAAAQGAVRGSLREFDNMFSWMDGRLEGKIGEALKAGSADERRGLARQSAQIAADYLSAARSQVKVKDLDDNPFAVKTRFGDTIERVMPALEKAVAQAVG